MNALDAIIQLIARRSEVVVTILVIGIIFMMILPLPTALVDVLIALNISISALLVVMVMYMPGPLAFSTFPALLLITTLFRLALSITTTRLILLQGDAGSIVETFGNFVVGGNLVVGLVVFLILIVVNFLVITKGSERVAEVSARFTLDAMPGKQMSIDSDLRAGLLTAEEAKKKRADLGKESQLFGALDGAMKFVKGDAIAGIIIVLVNIIGGFSIGVLQLGLSAGESIQLYSILTIGDGLVAQIPALLISLTAGIIITRVKNDDDDDSNVGRELASQLGSQPRALLLAALVLVGFGFIPGMPSGSFFVLAFFIAGLGAYKIMGAKTRLKKELVPVKDEALEAAENGEIDIRRFNVCDRVSVVTSEENANSAHIRDVIKKIRSVRNELVLNRGYMFPNIAVVQDKDLADDEFQLRIYDVPILTASVNQEKIAVDKATMPANELASLDIEYIEGMGSRNEGHLYWLDAKHKDALVEKGFHCHDDIQLIIDRTNNALLKSAHQFLGIEETNAVMQWATSEFPELTKELGRVLPVARFAEVLQNLVAENISIRAMRKIVESLVDQAAVERDIEVLTESVRVSLREQICHELCPENTMNVCLLDPNTEEMLRGSIRKTSTGGFFSLSQNDSERLIQEIETQISEHKQQNASFVMVVAQDIRRYFRDFISNDFFQVPVLSYAELIPTIDIKPVANISI